MQQVLYLFPDTNVFLQCKPLDQTTWESFGRWDRIEVVVTRPVQTEIDALKGNGNGRRAAKARAASSLLRRLLVDGQSELVLSSSPLVSLTVRLGLRADASVEASLNYNAKDDQLVGMALAFKKANPESVTRLLTDDTGVMFSAKEVDVQYISIPQEWSLPPESDESSKRERELRDKIAMYERSEPKFALALAASLDNTDSTKPEGKRTTTSGSKKPANAHTSGGPFKATMTMYSPLTEGEIEALISRLVERFPLASEFGPTEPQERLLLRSAIHEVVEGRSKEVFTPASPQRIEDYKSAYKAWPEKCSELFKKYHDFLNSRVTWPNIVATIANEGARPAEDALVCIEAEGIPKLLRPLQRQKNEKDEPSVGEFVLPAPPVVPKGEWGRVQLSPGLQDRAKLLREVSTFINSPEPLANRSFYPPAPPDPNTLYWKGSPTGRPLSRCELTCTQWRHAISAEEIWLNICFPLSPGTYSGQVIVTVHAANLTAPAKASLPVELVVEEASCAGLAAELVEAFKLPSSGFRLNLTAS